MEIFLLCFIPLFVALDPVGVMPIFLGLTESMPRRDRQKVLNQSVLTAVLVSLLFLFAGQWMFKVLGISLADFQVAGGILLLVLAIVDLVNPTKPERQPNQSVGVVPIGIPLIMGPAALTTLLVLGKLYPFHWVAAALLANMAVITAALYYAGFTEKIVGINGMQAVSKIISLFLAAIAVMFIRVGLQTALGI
ncbi:MAG: MarC family protein [Deltaproteobacteria bacterium]|nr:MarC family protein [Deltaproteobacteria bacterium]MDZ4224612.1 MarC family protein [bacterium]